MDYEQPDSTTELIGETATANDLISLGDDHGEAAPVKPSEYVPSSPKKEDVKKASSPVIESKPVVASAEDGGCPVCHFIEYVGQVTPQPVYEVLVWKDVYKTAVIFFTVLPLLTLYCYCNPIVVTAYLLLGLVTSTFTYRIYRYIIDTFQKSEVANPFLGFADLDVQSSRQVVLEWADRVLPIFVRLVNKLKHYILVEDILDTVKFAVLLYVTAVIGGYFSLRFLGVVGVAAAFTLPKVFALYKPQIIDAFENIHNVIKANLKLAKRKVLELKEQAISAASGAAKKRN